MTELQKIMKKNEEYREERKNDGQNTFQPKIPYRDRLSFLILKVYHKFK